MDNQQQDIWLKSAVIGSIWASFEIVFGSFFHSLRIPFAGTFLTFTSMVLLISFSYKWNHKNLFLKAGIIAALMRSLMPTSVVLGPLIGIMIEAVLFQLALNIFGRNLLAFAFAGILAMFSAIIHKIISIILIYGFDIVKILENLYFVLLKSTHINLPLRQLLWIVLLVYIVLGLIVALVGQRLGFRIQKLKSDKQGYNLNESWDVSNDLFSIQYFKYQSVFIFIHIFVLIVFLVGLEIYNLKIVVLPVVFYLFFLVKRYGNSLRRLVKPLFWIQLVIIVLMAVLLWQDKTEGLLVGIKMILRAVIVVAVFTAISVELKNPLVKALLYRKGYSQLYGVLGLATAAVPFILKHISNEKKTLINPFQTLVKAIDLSDVLLERFTKQMKQQSKIFVISGETRSGKTTFLKRVIGQLKQNNAGIRIGGIIAHGIDKQGERHGFTIENIATGQEHFLCSREKIEGGVKVGRFYFDEKGLSFGHQALTHKDLDWLIVDEVGYLELQGKGWFADIEKAMDDKSLNIILVVRKRILESVLKLWQHNNIQVIDIEKCEPECISVSQ